MTYNTNFSLKMLIYRGYNGRGPMMLVLSIMDGNKQEGKWLVVKHNALK